VAKKQIVEARPMMLLPPHPGKCQACAVDHKHDQPHNAQSLYYQMKFKMEKGRYPNWIDAMEHCDETTKTAWKNLLIGQGVDVDGGKVNPTR
jgi:hypothetical protein